MEKKKTKQQKMLLVILLVMSKLKKKRIRKDMIEVKKPLRKHCDSFCWVSYFNEM